ncbi:MAG TPA: hypothetical protein VL463_02150 [Kofleriaceae bacterium]|nr:hypothetical protein [Kofleriaceae bacterium]
MMEAQTATTTVTPRAHARAAGAATTVGAPISPNKLGERAAQLEQMSNAELEVVFLRGVTPEIDQLVGWEFRGTNTPPWMRLIANKKFVKGMFRNAAGEVYGYNCPCVQNRLDEPWITRPDDARPNRFGFYKVVPVDATTRDNKYLHALLLDYGQGKGAVYDPTRGLRDYLVQVDPVNPDLFLGKAYYAVGPARVPTNFFVLERHRTGLGA